MQALLNMLRALFGKRDQAQGREAVEAADIHPDDRAPLAAAPVADIDGDGIPDELDTDFDDDLSDVDVNDIADPLAGEDDAKEVTV